MPNTNYRLPRRHWDYYAIDYAITLPVTPLVNATSYAIYVIISDISCHACRQYIISLAMPATPFRHHFDAY